MGLQDGPSQLQLSFVQVLVPLPAVTPEGTGSSFVSEESPGLGSLHVELSSQFLQSNQVLFVLLHLRGLGLLGLGLGGLFLLLRLKTHLS